VKTAVEGNMSQHERITPKSVGQQLSAVRGFGGVGFGGVGFGVGFGGVGFGVGFGAVGFGVGFGAVGFGVGFGEGVGLGLEVGVAEGL